MNMLYVLIPLALVLLAAAVWALVWAIQSGQFDDLESQGWSVVLDEDRAVSPKTDDKEEPVNETDEGS
ncbi:MAG TPA: cbb3-type cytochrome oxidase assembly protein CcoS [Xanthomonadales bacterium]|nr:cbb3-type cytochrome oxidase assembly protein CcoS [Xanthomonadales bacterium]